MAEPLTDTQVTAKIRHYENQIRRNLLNIDTRQIGFEMGEITEDELLFTIEDAKAIRGMVTLMISFLEREHNRRCNDGTF